MEDVSLVGANARFISLNVVGCLRGISWSYFFLTSPGHVFLMLWLIAVTMPVAIALKAEMVNRLATVIVDRAESNINVVCAGDLQGTEPGYIALALQKFVSASITLNVIILFWNPATTSTPLEGRNALYKNRTVQYSTYSQITATKAYTFTLAGLLLSDDGIYRCEFTADTDSEVSEPTSFYIKGIATCSPFSFINSVRRNRDQFQCVYFSFSIESPKFQGLPVQSPAPADASETNAMNMQCIADGFPYPNISWLQNSPWKNTIWTRVDGDTETWRYINDGVFEVTSKLEVNPTENTFRNLYRCNATNDVKAVTSQFSEQFLFICMF